MVTDWSESIEGGHLMEEEVEAEKEDLAVAKSFGRAYLLY